MYDRKGTPLRVRGKKNNKKASIQSLKRNREFAKIHRDEEEETQQRIFSRLETLPPEILEVIFVLSQNLALSLASKRLRAVLTSKRLVEKITMDLSDSLGLFPANNIHYAEGRDAEVAFRSWEQCLKHPAFDFRWFELRTMQRLIDEARLLITIFWKDNGTSLSETQQNHQLAKIEHVAYCVRPSKPKYDTTKRRYAAHNPAMLVATKSIVYSRQRIAMILLAKERSKDSYSFIELCVYHARQMPDLSKPLDIILAYASFPSSGALSGDYTLKSKPSRPIRPWRCKHFMVPPFLYRAPFTQKRGNLLKFLLDNNARVPNPPFPPQGVTEAASAGLVEALNDGCLPAIYCLLPSCRSYAPIDGNILPFSWDELFSNNPPVLDLVPKDNQKPDAWRYIGGPVPDDNNLDNWLAVKTETLTEDHLRVCIDNLDRNPPIYSVLLDVMTDAMAARDTRNNSWLTSMKFLQDLTARREKYSGKVRRVLDNVWKLCMR